MGLGLRHSTLQWRLHTLLPPPRPSPNRNDLRRMAGGGRDRPLTNQVRQLREQRPLRRRPRPAGEHLRDDLRRGGGGAGGGSARAAGREHLRDGRGGPPAAGSSSTAAGRLVGPFRLARTDIRSQPTRVQHQHLRANREHVRPYRRHRPRDWSDRTSPVVFLRQHQQQPLRHREFVRDDRSYRENKQSVCSVASSE